MISIISQKTEFSPNIGDISPFDDSNKYILIAPEKDENKHLVPLGTLSRGNPFKTIAKLNIDFELINQKYNCPHTEMEFYSLVPLYLYSSDLTPYDFNFSEMAKDKEWNWDRCFDEDGYLFDNIDKAMLGTGYTSCTNAGDGCNELIVVSIELENGDKVICLTWNWFNK